MIHFSHTASGSGDWSKKIQVDSAGSLSKPARPRRDIETHHDVYASGNWRTICIQVLPLIDTWTLLRFAWRDNRTLVSEIIMRRVRRI